jgi:hypothetical protein
MNTLYYNMDFQCSEMPDVVVTITGIKAQVGDGQEAIRVALGTLSPQYSWKCIGFDSVSEA